MQWNVETLLALSEQSGALIGIYDASDRLRFSNAAFRSAFFIDADEAPLWADVMRRNHAVGRGTRIVAADFDLWLSSATCRRRKTEHRQVQTDLADGRWLLIDEKTLADGWMICVGLDVSGLGVTGQQALQDRDMALKAAQTDELTGISNRRHIMALLDAMVDRPQANGTVRGCLCLLDIDQFKTINDRFGHPAGDGVLVGLSRLVASNLRPSDGLGRVGGEEFMLVLADTDLTEGARTVERILGSLRESRPIASDPGWPVTCSAGLVERRPGDTAHALYLRADQALYRAKRDGRDRCCTDH